MKNEGKLSRKTNHFGSTIILLPILFSLGGLTFDLAKINSKEYTKFNHYLNIKKILEI